MQIVFISAELHPFSKVGGLGDVIGALPAALAAKGHTIRVITPGYGSIDRPRFTLETIDCHFSVRIAGRDYPCWLSRWTSPQNPNHEVYFIENNDLFASRGIYTNARGVPYADNAERFVLLCKAALKIIQRFGWQPEIIHCHDNHAALIPVYLKSQPEHYPELAHSRSILTLHNIAYQGIVTMNRRNIFDLPETLFHPTQAMEWYGAINPLKAGILLADAVTTVSPGHAHEIMEDEALSAGLKGVINNRGDGIVGILNGVDYSEWNPRTDRWIAAHYSQVDFAAGKRLNKTQLIRETGLGGDSLNRPLIGMVSRLVEQKGIHLLTNVLSRLLSLDIGLLVLGSGEATYEKVLTAFSRQFADKFRFIRGYHDELSHKIIAGSDLFLMPSRFEPCGITQMYSLKYGTVPIARQTGGLADTIDDWDGQTGTGFLFREYTAETLLEAVQRAVTAYRDPDHWPKIIRNGMQRDFPWSAAADKYLELYQKTAGN